MRTELVQLRTRTGRPVRLATKVVFDDGYEVVFTERMPRGAALRQAVEVREKELGR